MNQAALLVIDVQRGLDEPSLGLRSNPGAESNIARLLARWRAHHRPVIHIRHCSMEPRSPLRPELPGNAFKPQAMPHAGEAQFSKTVNSAFVGTGLEAYLRAQHIAELVVVGLTVEHCVSASVRTAADLGFDVTLVADATAAFEHEGFDGAHFDAETVHAVNLASLNREFCQVRTTEDVLREWP